MELTAHDLIEQWFGKYQAGVDSNMRFIAIPQVDLLRELCQKDEEGAAAIRSGSGRSFTWMPSGRWKYVITEGILGRRNTIMRLANLRAAATGNLFG